MEGVYFRRLAWKMVLMYLGFHGGMTLLTYRSEHRLSWQEHVTAANWALPGVVGFWLLLRWAVGLYRCDGVRKIPGAPFLGPYAQVMALSPALAVSAATVLSAGERVHPRSLWTLVAVLGVSAAALGGQKSLIGSLERREREGSGTGAEEEGS